MAKKEKLPRLTSPAGEAVWPKLNKPDTKFSEAGEYGLTLRLRPGNEEVDKFVADLTARYEASIEAAKAESKKAGKGTKIKVLESPVREVVDPDTDKPTGEVDIRFKMKAFVKPKDKEGWPQSPALFDAAGVNMGKPANAPRIGSGSTVKVNFEVMPFFSPGIGAGLSLRLRAVQVIKLVEFTAGTASSFGFGKEEGGFAYEPAEHADDELGGDSDDAVATKGDAGADGEF